VDEDYGGLPAFSSGVRRRDDTERDKGKGWGNDEEGNLAVHFISLLRAVLVDPIDRPAQDPFGE
jgi:hypothetical protein